jgi:hypothetical protein
MDKLEATLCPRFATAIQQDIETLSPALVSRMDSYGRRAAGKSDIGDLFVSLIAGA